VFSYNTGTDEWHVTDVYGTQRQTPRASLWAGAVTIKDNTSRRKRQQTTWSFSDITKCVISPSCLGLSSNKSVKILRRMLPTMLPTRIEARPAGILCQFKSL
jgi:hypothetical protein